MEVLPGQVQITEAAIPYADRLTEIVAGSLDYENPVLEYTIAEVQMRLGQNTSKMSRGHETVPYTENTPTFMTDKNDCRDLIADNVRLRQQTSTPFRRATPRPIDMPERLAEELFENILRHLQNSQEEHTILRVGERDFCTSRVTLRADQDSLFTDMLRCYSPFCPYRRNMYYKYRDCSQLRYILNYLRNGAHIDAEVLPVDRKQGSVLAYWFLALETCSSADLQ